MLVAQSSMMLQYIPAGKPLNGLTFLVIKWIDKTSYIFTSGKGFGHAAAFGHGEKSLVASWKSHSSAVVPVIVHLSSRHSVTEPHHFGDGIPSMLAHPSARAATVRIDANIYSAVHK